MSATSDTRRGGGAATSGGWWPAAVVFVLACLPYGATPWFDFVAYDDPDHVAGHPIIGRGLTLDGLVWAFGVGADPAHDGWFNWPLTWISHMADASLFASWPGGHHLVNVLFHGMNAALVLTLTRRLGVALPGALLVAAVFAVHPAQVESVAWVSERKTVLCACLMFLTILAYLQWRDCLGAEETAGADGRSVAWLIGWNALGLCALLAKPLAVTLPCVLLLCDAGPLRRARGASLAQRAAAICRCVPEKLPLFVAVVAMCVWTVASQVEAGAVRQLPLATRLAHAVVADATYLRVFLWPVGLGCFHPHPGMPTVAGFLAAAAGLVAATAIVTTVTRRGRPLALFGWLWFLGTLVPTIGVIQVGDNGWSDRYLYVPIVGLALVVVSLGEWAVAEFGHRRHGVPCGSGRVAAVGGVAWIAVLAVLGWRQTGIWRDTGALAAACLAANPGSAEAWNLLGVFQARRGDLKSAEQSFVEAISHARSPTRRADLLANLGRTLLDAGRDDDATRVFAAVVQAVPRHVAGRRGLGVALTRVGAEDRAAEVFAGLVRDRPGDAVAWVGYGNALYGLGRAAEAAGCYDRALAIDPSDAPTLANRAWARLASGDRAGAERDVEAVTALGHPIDPDLRAALRDAGDPPVQLQRHGR